MTGTSMGAHAPAISPLTPALTGASHEPGHRSTRTRHVHSVLMLGGGDATVSTSRQRTQARAVSITVRQGPLLLTGHLSAAQAQALGDALARASKAAEARESTHQWPDTATANVIEGSAT